MQGLAHRGGPQGESQQVQKRLARPALISVPEAQYSLGIRGRADLKMF